MTDKHQDERRDVLAAVMRLLARVPSEPSLLDKRPQWRESEKKTPPDSLY